MKTNSHKLPPQNLEAEQSLLGSLMIDKNAIIKIVDFLKPRDFYKKSHQEIYQTAFELFEKREPIDFLSVSARLKEKNLLQEVGGKTYLSELVNSVPTASHVTSYAKIVQKKRILRDLIESSQEIESQAYQEAQDVDSLLDYAEKRIFGIAEHSLSQSFSSIKDSLEETFERIDALSKHQGAIRGVATGFPGLDNILSGLQKSDLIILAARPSLGKSSLAFNIALNAATNKVPVGVFSLEMSKDQIIDRFIATLASIDLWKLRTGRLSSQGDNNDFQRIQKALSTLSQAEIYIDDSASSNVLQMRAMTRRLQADKGIGLIIVDYLQLMDSTNDYNSMVQQMSQISRSLKGLAKELNIPVLALSQLSRAVEQRTPQIPRLSDLRESGCLTGDTLITRSDTGEMVTMESLLNETNIPVHSLNENSEIQEAKISKVFFSGIKTTYQITTETGFRIKASANHPFWTIKGWTRLDQLKVKDKIATPSRLKTQPKTTNVSDNELIQLAQSLENEIPKKVFSLDDDKLALFLETLLGSENSYSSDNYQTISMIKGLFLRLGVQTMILGNNPYTLELRKENFYQLTETFNYNQSNLAVKTRPLAKSTETEIFWDEIKEIKELGKEKVYDATVPNLHNFIANNIIVHNSIEQDADVVLFIHREDKYRSETSRKNIADIMVAKHRNGPIGKTELYFDETTATFRNLDKSYEEETY
jgi:replicative DNA helicase